MHPTRPTPVIIWLSLCAVMVALMVMVGGLTRLSESGLSIVQWKPVSGTLPPLSEASWQQEFEHYQQSPQYLKVNKGMALEEFKSIFWLEYIHRLLARLVGIVFLMPLVWFSTKGTIKSPLTLKLTGIFVLGGLQGLVGWYMVKSGLVDNPWVSPLRLAFHLGLAFLIFALLLWQVLGLLSPKQAGNAPRFLQLLAPVVAALIFIQVLLGALVAGLDAGLSYNTYPLMDGQWVPAGLFIMEPAIRNLFENVAMVQFNHRMGAHLLAVLLPAYGVIGYLRSHNSSLKMLFLSLIAVFFAQFVLGVLTLVNAVPIALATLHQINALILFGVSIALWHRIWYAAQEEYSNSGAKLVSP